MDDLGFKVVRDKEHLLLFRYGVFQCSGDTKAEIEEEKRLILGR